MIHRQPGFEAPPANRDSGNTLGEARRYMFSADRIERAIRYGGCPEGAVSQLGPVLAGRALRAALAERGCERLESRGSADYRMLRGRMADFADTEGQGSTR
jgi:hypothetical protein